MLSDFANTTAWNTEAGQGDERAKEECCPVRHIATFRQYALKQNFPNPFNPVTNIQYDLPFDNFVSIKIYDILGKEVVTLVNEMKNAGRYIFHSMVRTYQAAFIIIRSKRESMSR
ncbi:MAG: T9SS type A sorting domain-containing protein [Ignavibacteria bacterium]|nr:T9SS type A sorting domain-containing protein [Ignavibacteria bacterium]